MDEQNIVLEKSIFVATNGSDENGTGTIESPYQTLHHAQEIVKPGETVYFRKGTYPIHWTDFGVIYSKGTEDNWITFKNFEDEKVIFDGTGRGSLISNFRSIITLYKSEYVIFDGFEVTNSTTCGGITNFDSYNTIIRNCEVHNVAGRGVGGNGRHQIYEGNKVYHTCMSNERNNRNIRGGWAAGLATILRPYNAPTTDVIIRNNEVYENWGEGIDAFLSSDVVIENNLSYDNYSVNVYVDTGKNIIIRNNTIHARNTWYYRDNRPAIGIMLSDEGTATTKMLTPNTCIDNILIENNDISDVMSGICFWEDKENTWETNTYKDITINNNTIDNTWEYDLFMNKVTHKNVPLPSGCKFTNNKIYPDKRNRYMFVGDPDAWEFENNQYIGIEPFPDEGFPRKAL